MSLFSEFLVFRGPPPAASRTCPAMPTAAPPMRSAPGVLLRLKGEDVVVLGAFRGWERCLRSGWGPPPTASRPCCAMPTAAPPMRSALGALLPLRGEDVVVLGVFRGWGRCPRSGWGLPPTASRPCCAMPAAAPPMRSALGVLLRLKGEDVVVLAVLGFWEALFRPLRGQGSLQPALVPREHTSSVSLDRVVRSVSASEQSDESGTYPPTRRPPSPPNPRPDSRPGTRHQPSNPANHRFSAPGPHRGSRGTYGVVPRPEGPGEDGVLPGRQGGFGGARRRARSAQKAPR